MVVEPVYHGSGTRIERFDFRFTDIGNDQLGSGFYFTTDLAEAVSYTGAQLNGAPKPGGQGDPTVMVARLTLKNPLIEDAQGRITLPQAYRFLERSPLVDDALENWGDVSFEGRRAVMARAADAYMVEAAPLLKRLHVIANDLYRGHTEAFNQVVREILGYDGVVATIAGAKRHYVAWFPDQIEILEWLPRHAAEQRLADREGESPAVMRC